MSQTKIPYVRISPAAFATLEQLSSPIRKIIESKLHEFSQLSVESIINLPSVTRMTNAHGPYWCRVNQSTRLVMQFDANGGLQVLDIVLKSGGFFSGFEKARR